MGPGGPWGTTSMKQNMRLLSISGIFLIAVSFALSQIFSNTDESELEDRLVELYACSLEDSYEYMFANHQGATYDGKTVELFGRKFGMYTGGTRGLVHYTNFTSCLRRVAGMPPVNRWGDTDPIAKVSGMNVYQTGDSDSARDRTLFSLINPRIIMWGAANLIPDPKEKMDGKSFQEIYDVVFQRFARLMVESYLLTHHRMDYEKEQLEYLKRVTLKPHSQYFLEWLSDRYGMHLVSYRTGADYGSLEPEYAIGFWLRRGLDGTDDEVYSALRKLMNEYDPQWFRQITEK